MVRRFGFCKSLCLLLLITEFVKDGGGFGESQAFFYDLLILFVFGLQSAQTFVYSGILG